eukprot:3411743-Prymnesium_polylepis.1
MARFHLRRVSGEVWDSYNLSYILCGTPMDATRRHSTESPDYKRSKPSYLEHWWRYPKKQNRGIATAETRAQSWSQRSTPTDTTYSARPPGPARSHS